MADTSFQVTAVHRGRIETFQREHHLGLLTLVFTDLVGSLRLKQQLGDLEALALMEAEKKSVRLLLQDFPDAQEVGTAGDSFFLVFARPSDAVRFALRMHSRDRELAFTAPERLTTRIGIYVGEVFISEGDEAGKGKDILGTQVDACARLMAMAEGGQTLLSRFAFDNARQVLRGRDLPGVGALAWVNHGAYELAGLEDPLEVCEVGEAGIAPLKPPKDTSKGRRSGELVLGWRPACGETVPDTQWVLEQKLGEGAFGEAWLAQHQWLKERRVFKFCFRADRVRSLKRELTLFRVLKEKVGHHPNIVTVHDVYLDQAPYYLATEYVPGKNLRGWWKERQETGALPDEALRLEIVAQIADALQAAHEAGVIHRDVKPTNILIHEALASRSPAGSRPEGHGPEAAPARPEGRDPHGPTPRLTAKLADFGIGQVVSKEVLEQITKLGFTATLVSPGSSRSGTQIYMAPELLSGKTATTRSDLYSLGVVLYQLLVGDLERPLTGDWMDEITDSFLRGDLRRCLAGKPEERFSNAGQLAQHLRSLPARREVPVRQAAQLAARRRFVYSRGAPLITAVVLLLGAGMRLWNPGFLERTELGTYDLRVRYRARHNLAEVTTNLGFVFISEESIKAVKNGSLGYRFGLFWPRQVYGRLIRELAAQGAKAIAFDVLFGETRPDHPPVMMANGELMESDEFFALELQRASNTILGVTRNLEEPALFLTNAVTLGDVSTDKDSDGVLRRVKAFQICRLWHPALVQLEADRAYGVQLSRAEVQSREIVFPRNAGQPIQVPLRADGMFDLTDFYGNKLPRGMPRWAKPFTDERVWQMGVVLAAKELNLDLSRPEIDLPQGRITLHGPNGVVRVLPVDANGYLYINWCLPPNDPRLFQQPIEVLLAQDKTRLEGRTNNLTAPWRGKLVLVGSSTAAGEFADRGATPLGRDALLVSKHWNVASSIITGRFIRRASLALELSLMALLSAAAGVIAWRFRAATASVLVAILTAAYVVACFFVFDRDLFWLPMVPPCASLLAVYVCLLVWRPVSKALVTRLPSVAATLRP